MYVRIQSDLKSVSSLKWAPVCLPLGPSFFTGHIVFELRLVHVHDLWSWNYQQFIQTWFSPQNTEQWILLWSPHFSSGWILIRRTCCKSSGSGWDTAESSLRSLPICRKPLCLFPSGAVCVCVCVCVCVNLFSGAGITPASLAQLCCPSGTVSSFDADLSLFLYFLVCFSKGIKYVPYSNKSSEGHFQCAFNTWWTSFSSRNSEHYLLFPWAQFSPQE